MTNFVKSGDNLTLAAPYDVLSGGGFKVGNVFGVAANDTLSGNNVECEVEGVYDPGQGRQHLCAGRLGLLGRHGEEGDVHGRQQPADRGGGGGRRDRRCRCAGLFGVPGFSGQAHGLKVAYAKFDFSVDGGASCTPTVSDTIPMNAVVFGGSVVSTTAVVFGGSVVSTTAVAAAGSATVSIGTVAGSGAASILAATAKASLGTNALVVPTAVATPFKMSAAGKINVTIATGPLTAGGRSTPPQRDPMAAWSQQSGLANAALLAA